MEEEEWSLKIKRGVVVPIPGGFKLGQRPHMQAHTLLNYSRKAVQVRQTKRRGRQETSAESLAE